jgi:nicotinamide riboside kinase
MTVRIGFCGIPGTGKTSTARALAAMCRKIEKFKRVELVSEYARRYIFKYGSEGINLTDQYKIMEKQIEWESSIPEETDLIITDSPVHLGFIYALELRKDSYKDAMYINDIFKRLNKINAPEKRYDVVFYLPPILDPIKDGIRHEAQFTPEWREKADWRIKYVFDLFPPKHFIELKSTELLDRVDESLKVLGKINIT